MPLVRKAHVLADEGCYYVTNNAQTGIVPTYGTSISATAPLIVIQNQNTLSQRAYIDYVSLSAIAAGACTTTLGYTAIGVVIDSALRYTSGGTNLSSNIVNVNTASATNSSGVNIYCGAITAAAATAARTLVGIRNVRPGVSSTVMSVVGDNILLNFGGVEAAMSGNVTVANANLIPQPLPPLVIAPGHSALIYIWYPVVSAPSAATYAPEIGFWVR